MADGVPLSAEVTRALLRCALTSGTVGLWESLLLGAVKRYRSAVSVKGNTTTLGVSGMARRSRKFSQEPKPDGEHTSDDEALDWLIV